RLNLITRIISRSRTNMRAIETLYGHTKIGRMIALILFGVLCSFSGYSQTFYEIDSLKNSLEHIENDSVKGMTAIKISREIHRKAHNEEEEYKYAELAIELALQNENKLFYAKALDNLGLLYRYHQYYNESLDLHIKAFKLVEN